VKGEYKVMDGMEEGIKVNTLVVQELVEMNPEKNCN